MNDKESTIKGRLAAERARKKYLDARVMIPRRDIRQLHEISAAARAFAQHFGEDGYEMVVSDPAWDDLEWLQKALQGGQND